MRAVPRNLRQYGQRPWRARTPQTQPALLALRASISRTRRCRITTWSVSRPFRSCTTSISNTAGRGQRKPPGKPETPETDTPENWSRRVKEYALANEGDLVGIARVNPEWVFEGYEAPEPWIVVSRSRAMDHGELAKRADDTRRRRDDDAVQPGHPRGRARSRISSSPPDTTRAAPWRAGGRAGDADPRRHRGRAGRARQARLDDQPDLRLVLPPGRRADRPAARRRRTGRIRGRTISAPRCQVCTDACPPDAISREKVWGARRRALVCRFSTSAVPYFNDTQGCGICIGRLPLEPARDRPQTRREDDPAPSPARRSGLKRSRPRHLGLPQKLQSERPPQLSLGLRFQAHEVDHGIPADPREAACRAVASPRRIYRLQYFRSTWRLCCPLPALPPWAAVAPDLHFGSSRRK